MKTVKIIVLIFASALPIFAQCGINGTLIRNPLSGQWDCTGKVGAAGYVASFTGVTGLTVTAATHGQGVKPFGECWDNGTPANKIAQTANFPTVSATGTIVFAWSGSKTGYCIISALGNQQGAPGINGTNGTNGTNGNTILNGAGAPTAGDGVDGDFWLRTSNSCLYGPKASGAWPGTCVSLAGDVVGPASAVNGNVVTFNGTTGKLIQDGGKALPSGAVVGTTDAQTLTNKTLTQPVIGNLTSAQHDHSNAAGGGNISSTAFAAGSKQGDGTKLQMFAGSAPATDDCAKFDANGNIATAGAPCGSGGGGGVSSVTIAGTSRKISVSGTCTITTTGTCTLTLPADLLLPINTGLTASTTAGPSFNIPSGVAPTSPVSGDFWNLSGILQYYDGSVMQSVVTLAATQTLTNKTLTTPTIASFANATHNHQNAAGGGVLDVAAITSGAFAKARQFAATAYTDAGNTWSTGAQDFGAASSLKIVTGAGAAPTANGLVAYDSTANLYKFGFNGTSKIMAALSGSFADNDCLKYQASTNTIITSGAACGSTGFTPTPQAVTSGSTTSVVVPYGGTLSDKTQAVPSCMDSSGNGVLAGSWVGTTTQMTISFSPSATFSGACTAVIQTAGGGGGGSGTVTNTGTLTSGQIIKGNGGTDITAGNLTGDVTTSGGMATTLATVNGSPGACGDSTHVCQVTTNGKGLVTAQSAVLISGGGGASSVSQLTDFQVTKTSGTVLTGNAACTSSAPCNVAVGGNVCSFTSSFTVTVSSGSPTARIWANWDGATCGIYVGNSASSGLACNSGCTIQNSTSTFPVSGARPLYQWTAASVVWGTNPDNDFRAMIAIPKTVSVGTGFVKTETATNIDISPDANFGVSGALSAGVGGSTAGALDLVQGTAPGGQPANSFRLYSPTSIGTAYAWKVPAADAAGVVASDGSGALSVIGTTGSGNLLRGTVAVPNGGTGLTSAWARPVWFSAATCNNATAGASFDLPTSNAPSPSCNGTSYRFGALDYADSANQTATFHYLLPTGWTGNVDFLARAFVNGTSQSVKLTIATICVANSEDILNPTFNTAQTITVTSPGTANQQFEFTQTNITMTGCAANELLLVKVGRDVTDTSTSTFSVIGAQLVTRVTPQN